MKKQLFLLLWSSIALFAQAPNISYPAGTYTFDTGTAITPLSPINTGGSVPATIYGQVSTVGGEGPAVSFNNPTGVAVDSAGNVYVADRMNNKIRKITPLGIVTTFAGSGGFGSADGTGAAASFYNPIGVTVDSANNVYVADLGNAAIRKITQTGVVITLAGSGFIGSADGLGIAASFNSPSGVTIDSSGNLYVADLGNNKIRKITSAGVVTTLAGIGTAGSADGTGAVASFNSPSSVTVDKSGNVYVADYGNHKIRKITLAGVVTTLAGKNIYGAVDGKGSAASFYYPKGVSVDSEGNVYVTENLKNTIRKVTSSGVVSTIAGSGTAGSVDGTVTAASFNSPSGVAVDLAGNVYVADTENHRIRKITAAGVVSTLAGSGLIGSADSINTAASFYSPSGVTVDLVGNVYVADTWNNKIRKITPTGEVTTLAGNSIGPGGSVDGTGTAARFDYPTGLAVDTAGNVYVTDGASNNNIRKITPAGVVTTLAGNRYVGSADGFGTAASFYYPKGVAVDTAANVYVSDRYNNKIRKITPAGAVTTLAGNGTVGSADGLGSAASFYQPTGLSVDSAGNVYVADANNNLIRKVTPSRMVTTLAGSSTVGATDGNGIAAKFSSPSSVAVDSANIVYVADALNGKIRKILATGYAITPALVSGLNFDSTTGIISGTPTVSSATTNYTITAYNASGSSSTTVTIATTTLGTTTFSKQDLKLYPNPVTSLLHIQTPNTNNIDNVIIFDLTGKKVLEQAQNTSQVDVAHLAKGVYIIEVFSGKEKFSSKFMKE